MIRSLWVGLVLTAATFFYGFLAILATLVRVRGPLYSRLTSLWARSILSASRTPVRVHGGEHIRADRPQIIVSNHISGYDIFALASVLEVPYAFVGKKELDRIPFFGRAWRAAGHISIDRSNRQQAIATLQEAGRRIREENSTVIIFPEGTRSRTGELLPFKKGAFTLALEAGVPIIPTVIVGSNRIMRNGWRVHPSPIEIHFGPPMPVDRSGARSIDALVDRTHARMREMLGDGKANLKTASG